MARTVGERATVLPMERTDALTIAGLYNEVEGAIAAVFPAGRQVWVRGEVQQVSDRTGHCYLDLVDHDDAGGRDAPVLKVKCWRSTWSALKGRLSAQGIELQQGMVVTLLGRLDLYRARGELGFIVSDIDVSALLGRLAAQRAALLQALEAEGLLVRNRGLRVPDVPLRIGLVSSPGTEGHRDFLGQLAASPFAFDVVACPAVVQGSGAPASLVAALEAVVAAGCDLAVVVRGGGSRGDLAAFDSEPVARAVACCTVPVWTGIGHTGDRSVADIVANRAHITPTECGQELVRAVAAWWESVGRRASRLAVRSQDVLGDASRAGVYARSRLVACTRLQLDRHAERLVHRTRHLTVLATERIEEAALHTAARASHLGPAATGVLDRHADRVQAWRRLIAAYDIDGQLRRGYTLTTDGSGRIVRSADALRPGDGLVTRFADGTARSVVTTTEPHVTEPHVTEPHQEGQP